MSMKNTICSTTSGLGRKKERGEGGGGRGEGGGGKV